MTISRPKLLSRLGFPNSRRAGRLAPLPNSTVDAPRATGLASGSSHETPETLQSETDRRNRMKRCAWLILVALSAVPAASDDKKKDEKKGKEAAQAPVVVDPVKDAEAKLAAGDADGAIKVLEGAMATNGAAALKLGVLRESRGELDVAVDAYKAASATLTGAAKGEALGRMSVAQDDRGMSEAGATADAAVAADPEGVWPTIAMARRRANEGKPDEAIALAQKAVGAGGGAPATAALARAQESKGDMAAAEASYKQAIAGDAKSISATVGLATVLRKTGRAAEAEPMLAKLIDAQPGAVAAYKEMARVKIAQGRAQDALADANIAAAMSEGDADAKELVAEVRVASAMQSVAAGQVDVAVADLMRLRDENPSSAAVRIGLAKAQIARRDPASAITELQKAVELDPKNAEAHYQLGTVLLRMKGDAASAVTSYQKAVELEPGNTAYATALGTSLVAAQQSAPAIDLLTKLTAQPDYKRPEGFVSLGQAYVQAKRYKDAVPALEKATSLAPENADAWATLGWAYFGMKDAAKFKETAGKARTLGYKEPNLLDYLKKIEGGMTIK
jgi:tetratricopeptide (TPR) repeat protein